MTLDQHHPFYVAANTLRSEMTKCKGAARFKLAEETEALYGLQNALMGEPNRTALETLGLDKIAAALWEANEAVKTALDARNAERGERAEGRADGSVPELRKTVSDLLCRCAKRVTALYMITPRRSTARATTRSRNPNPRRRREATKGAEADKETVTSFLPSLPSLQDNFKQTTSTKPPTRVNTERKTEKWK